MEVLEAALLVNPVVLSSVRLDRAEFSQGSFHLEHPAPLQDLGLVSGLDF